MLYTKYYTQNVIHKRLYKMLYKKLLYKKNVIDKVIHKIFTQGCTIFNVHFKNVSSTLIHVRLRGV